MSYKHTRIIRFLSLCLCFCLFFNQTGFAQVLPSALNHSLSTPPLLRYLSVNPANPFNYFNFLLDKGDTSEVAEGLLGGGSGSLNSQAKKLIHYFFLGITLPSSSFWVNLRPDSPDRITSEELAKTDLGRVLLAQDLQLKKDVSRFLHPNHPQGKQYWERLYSTIGKDKAKKAKITTSNRVWIVPEEATVLETEDGALVVSAKLKVLLESEYLSLKKQGLQAVSTSEEESLRFISEQLMKEIVLPAITQDINTSSTYAPLRQIYHSLILAEWFKRKHKHSNSVYSLSINQSYTQGLESELPWSKDTFYQQYLKSYSEGEYKLEENLFGLRRMYWSGGVSFMGENSIVNVLQTKFVAGSPLIKEEFSQLSQNMFLGIARGNAVSEPGVFPKTEVTAALPDKIIKGAPLPEKGLSAEESQENQPTETTGASFSKEKEEIASSAAEELKESVVSPVTPEEERQRSKWWWDYLIALKRRSPEGFALLKAETLQEKREIFEAFRDTNILGLIDEFNNLDADIRREIMRDDSGYSDYIESKYKTDIYNEHRTFLFLSPRAIKRAAEYLRDKLDKANPHTERKQYEIQKKIQDEIRERDIIKEAEANGWISASGLPRDLVSPEEVKNLGGFSATDFIAVHRTNYLPEGGVIKTHLSATAETGRDTIHFTLNHPVASHMYGNWDKQEYTILVPLYKIPKHKIENFNLVDTWVVGDLELPEESIVLGPKGVDNADNTGKAKYIEIEPGKESIDRVIKNFGYTPKPGGMWSWGDSWGWTYRAQEFAGKEGLRYGTHSGHWRYEFERLMMIESYFSTEWQGWRVTDTGHPLNRIIEAFLEREDVPQEAKKKLIDNISKEFIEKYGEELWKDFTQREELFNVKKGENFLMPKDQTAGSPLVEKSSSSAVTEVTKEEGSPEYGGIDLSQIELTLKDEKFISSLNPAERQILLAAKYFKDGWESLTLLYIHQIMLMLKDNLIKDIQNRDLLFGILNQLKLKDFLDPQALQFLHFLHSQKPLSEIKMVLVR